MNARAMNSIINIGILQIKNTRFLHSSGKTRKTTRENENKKIMFTISSNKTRTIFMSFGKKCHMCVRKMSHPSHMMVTGVMVTAFKRCCAITAQ